MANGERTGRVVSVNVGQPRELEWLGRLVTTAIWKSPVEGRIAVVDAMSVDDDVAGFILSEDCIQPGDVRDPTGDHVAQDVARTYAR